MQDRFLDLYRTLEKNINIKLEALKHKQEEAEWYDLKEAGSLGVWSNKVYIIFSYIMVNKTFFFQKRKGKAWTATLSL